MGNRAVIKNYSPILRMLGRLVFPLVFLLGIVGTTNPQYGTCDYFQQMVPGLTYPIYSPGYTNNYTRGTYCQWSANSPRPIHMHCDTFQVAQTIGCVADVVIVKTGSGPGLKYCGAGKLDLITEGNEITISLHSSPYFRGGGRFFCTLQTIEEEKNNCNCGCKNPARIVRGRETGINEYPMMAGIVDRIDRIISCGATIINNRQVLTAAHCINGIQNPLLNMAVVVGEHDPTKGDETDATEFFRTESFAIHPNYISDGSDYDIGIVTVDRAIRFSQKVGPACLPFHHVQQDTFTRSSVDILGWGTVGISLARSDVLMKADVTVIANAHCQTEWTGITPRQICTWGREKDACQYDSGGPVLWRNPRTNRIVLVGIIDYGSICGSGKSAVNTRVGAFLDWILANSPSDFVYCREE